MPRPCWRWRDSLLLGVPTVMLGNSFATHVQEAYAAVAQDGTLHIPPPGPGVAEWPIVGKKIVRGLELRGRPTCRRSSARTRNKLKDLSRKGLAAAASTAVAVLLFLGAMIIAAIMMAYAESGSRAMQRIFSRLTDPVRGPRLQKLATATVRSVAAGVIGVAFIQAILLGMGFIFAGIPAAGVLALLVMFLGILQVPALLVTLPGDRLAVAVRGRLDDEQHRCGRSTCWIAGMADNVLKPLLLGRGVDAPMPVILIGALGGMVAGGIIGLFVGGVVPGRRLPAVHGVGRQLRRSNHRQATVVSVARATRPPSSASAHRSQWCPGCSALSGCATVGPDFGSPTSPGSTSGSPTCMARSASRSNRHEPTCVSGRSCSTTPC